MKIISFGWTSDLLLQDIKTVTRRKWKRQFVNKDEIVQAYNKSPLYKGHCIAILKIKDVKIERIRDITDSEVIKEGFVNWKVKDFLKFWFNKNPNDNLETEIYKIEFEVLNFKELPKIDNQLKLCIDSL